MLEVSRGARDADREALIQLAVAAQIRDDRHIIYLGTTTDGIRAELDGTEGWPTRAVVARRGAQHVGWLLADVDPQLGRVWWVGPFVAAAQPWRAVADRLYTEATAHLPDGIGQQEAAADVAHVELRAWAVAHGLAPGVPSAVLHTHAIPEGEPQQSVHPMRSSDAASVAALHATLFPDAHLTPGALVEQPGLRWVCGQPAVGYLAAELQPDGSGYIDFVGVHPGHRRRGVARALVHAAIRSLRASGAHGVHLTVRIDNVGALALYHAMGFAEERRVCPYRLGFQPS